MQSNFYVEREGVLFFQFANSAPTGGGSAGYGERAYDWNNKVTFAMKASEIGLLLSSDGKSLDLFHDPEMGKEVCLQHDPLAAQHNRCLQCDRLAAQHNRYCSKGFDLEHDPNKERGYGAMDVYPTPAYLMQHA